MGKWSKSTALRRQPTWGRRSVQCVNSLEAAEARYSSLLRVSPRISGSIMGVGPNTKVRILLSNEEVDNINATELWTVHHALSGAPLDVGDMTVRVRVSDDDQAEMKIDKRFAVIQEDAETGKNYTVG